MLEKFSQRLGTELEKGERERGLKEEAPREWLTREGGKEMGT